MRARIVEQLATVAAEPQQNLELAILGSYVTGAVGYNIMIAIRVNPIILR
jgi:hypothetical protein